MSAGTVVSIFLVAVIVLGYVVLWAIWHFFFRGRDVEHQDDGRRGGESSSTSSSRPDGDGRGG